MTDVLFVVPTSFIPSSLNTSKIDIVDDDDSEIDSTFATKQEESSEKSETLENVSEKSDSDSEEDQDNDSDNEVNEDKNNEQEDTASVTEDTQHLMKEDKESKEDIDVEISIKNENSDADNIQTLIDAHTIKDLREMCRNKNLSARGSKKDLATRYCLYSESNEEIGDDVVICS
tara:strand:+ start:398 stop:919 length:522 start_codon:yes stop_codon:yes gene_type:complete